LHEKTNTILYYIFKSNHGEITQDNTHEYIAFVLQEIIRIARTSERADMLFCGEGKHSLQWRRNIYPQYKANRKQHQQTEEFEFIIQSIEKIKEGIQLYGFKYIDVPEYEADDVIYSLSRYLQDQYERIIIYSTDKDLIQICNVVENVIVYNLLQQKFYEKQEDIITMKAIVGDSSDNISGLHRIGIKTYEKMKEDKAKWFDVMHTGENKKLFEQILCIVDLSKRGGEDVIQSIYDDIQTSFDSQTLEAWLFENKQKTLFDSLHEDAAMLGVHV